METTNEKEKVMIIHRIVAQSARDNLGFSVIAARVSGVHPYVTWLVDAEGHRHHGDYCSTAKDCLQSYLERCAENGVEA